MFDSLPQPRHMPCPDCGASLDAAERDRHACDDERWATYQLFQLRHEVAEFDGQLAAWLDSPHGRFAAWDAERQRR